MMWLVHLPVATGTFVDLNVKVCGCIVKGNVAMTAFCVSF